MACAGEAAEGEIVTSCRAIRDAHWPDETLPQARNIDQPRMRLDDKQEVDQSHLSGKRVIIFRHGLLFKTHTRMKIAGDSHMRMSENDLNVSGCDATANGYRA
jgi:hypothetical protein